MRERFLPPTLSTPPGGIPSQIDPDFGVALRATSPFANRGREPFVQGMLHPCGECGQKCCYLHFRITDLSTVGSISKIGQVLGTLNFVKSGRMNVRTLCTLRHVRYVRYVMYVTSCTLRHVRYVRYVMYATSCTLCALRHVRYVMYVTYATLCTLRHVRYVRYVMYVTYARYVRYVMYVRGGSQSVHSVHCTQNHPQTRLP